MLEDLSSDISARPVRPHMGHRSRDSYFSRGIPPICARDRSFSSAELCHNQTDPLPKGDKKPGCQKQNRFSGGYWYTSKRGVMQRSAPKEGDGGSVSQAFLDRPWNHRWIAHEAFPLVAVIHQRQQAAAN